MAIKIMVNPINSKQWQDNSDGWVKTMHASREKKEVLKLGECTHSIEEWCEVCQYDENGDKYEF
jgi:hypothetical protein